MNFLLDQSIVRDRYQSASELQCYSGIAPVLASSGKQYWVHWRSACPKFLPQTFQEWAVHSLASCAWAKGTTTSNVPKANRQTPSCELLRTSGFAFCFVVGRTAHRIVKALICRDWNVAKRSEE